MEMRIPSGAGTTLNSSPEYRERRFNAFNGGFHTLLESHRLIGRMFGELHLHIIWNIWRPTEGQLNWVMNPGDPNQKDNQIIMYYFR